MSSIEKTLNVQKRVECGKGPAGRVRAKNMIPGVFYTAKGDNISVQSPVLPFEKLFAEVGHTTVFHLEIDDNGTKTTYPALVWEVQRHPYKNQYTHIDFYGVDLDKEVKVDVPVEYVGVSRGVKLGGVMDGVPIPWIFLLGVNARDQKHFLAGLSSDAIGKLDIL